MRTQFTRRARLMSGGAAAVMLLAFAGAAQAQTADEAEVDEIIVTGIRAGIESSINEKKNNTSIVEVVTAEDIGKLPDVSIAEALARLPGLASQRQDGRSQAISIRGLGPDFTTALLNGREQVTTGDTPDDVVHLTELPPVDRAILAEATRVVTNTQRRMGNMARFVLPEMQD